MRYWHTSLAFIYSLLKISAPAIISMHNRECGNRGENRTSHVVIDSVIIKEIRYHQQDSGNSQQLKSIGLWISCFTVSKTKALYLENDVNCVQNVTESTLYGRFFKTRLLL